MPDTDMHARAHLHRVVWQATKFHRVLNALPPEAAARIGLEPADLDRISQLASHALWTSTADLHQRGEDELAQRVIARAAELDAEGEQ